MRVSLLVVSLVLSAARLAPAQVAASLSGRVEDATGSPVQAVKVTVRNAETGATRTALTDEQGNYRVLALAVGLHEVKAEKTGFRASVRMGVNLAVGQEAVVNLRLDVGEITQEVTVSADAPLVNTTTAQISGLVTEQQVKDLPLNGRSFDNLITLNPGTVNYSAMKTAQTSTSNGNTFSVAGRRTSENLFLLNGVEYTGSSQLAVTPGGASGQLLGIDAIREFNVQTDTYSAEYGKRAGAQVTVVTQSGGNVLHGSAFEFLRNSAVDARNFFDQGSVPPFRRNQFGGALGGPLKKDKLFLFGNYEGFRQALAVSNVTVVPDQQTRQGILPVTSQSCSVVNQPVANLNKSMLPYAQLFWPAVNGPELTVKCTPQGGGASILVPSGTALSYNNPRQSVREDFGTLRGDYVIRPQDSLSMAYTIDDGNDLFPLADPLFGSDEVLRAQVASLQEIHVFSPELLNTFRVGFSRAAFNYDSYPLASFPSSVDFVTGAGPGGVSIGAGGGNSPTGAVTAAGPNNNAHVWNRRNLFTYADDFQIIKGRHQLSIGAWFQRLQDNEDTASRQLGTSTFSSLTTFLQGTASNFSAVLNPSELGWRSLFGAWYVQDTIKLRPNLTLEGGLRYEFTTGWNEVTGRASNYLTDSNGVLETNPVVGHSEFTRNNATHLLGPRAGVAWSPFASGKTAIRAGYGMYYSLIDSLNFLLNALPPYNGTAAFAGNLFSFVPLTAGSPFPPSCGPGIPTVSCTTYAPQGVQPDAKTQTVQEWKFSVEQQLNANTAVRVAYVGTFGYHGLLNIDLNSIPTQVCANPNGCVSGGTPGTTKGNVTQGTQYIPVTTRPNHYLSGGFFWYTEGNSSYNALQVDVTRRLSQGLLFRANYTWSKNLDFNSGLTGAQATNQAQMVLDRNDLRRDWGLSALNITNQASFSGHYELPFGNGKYWLRDIRGAGGKLLSGWQLNGIGTILSGFPFTPQIGANRSGDGDTRNPDRPSLNPAFSGNVVLGNPNQWFNPNAFVLPTPGTYGNLGRGTFTGPGLADVDLSIFKDTRISERANLEFRSEVFNLFNRANFGTPNAIVFSGSNYSGSAGLITATTTTSRQIQFGLKLIF